MNFWSTERLTSALQAVGNIIAPLPDDYSPEYDRGASEADWQGRSELHNSPIIETHDILESAKEKGYDLHPFKQPTPDDQEDVIQRVDTSQSDWSVNDIQGAIHVDSDSDSLYSENLSPTKTSTATPERSSPLQEVSIESLEQELQLSKLKIASAFAEISSLSDDLRDSIRKNNDYEKELQKERETHKILQSRIEDLIQSKEQLAIQLSEILESQQQEDSQDQKRQDMASIQNLERTCELFQEENRRLAQSLSECEVKSSLMAKQAVQNISLSALSFFDLLDLPKIDSSEATEQAICDYLQKAQEKIMERQRQSERNAFELSELKDQIHQIESALNLERQQRQLLEVQNEKLQQDLNLENLHFRELEQQCQLIIKDESEKLLSCQKQLTEYQQMLNQRTNMTPENFTPNKSHQTNDDALELKVQNLQLKLLENQQERDCIVEFIQYLETSDPIINAEGYGIVQFPESLTKLKSRWIELISSNESLRQRCDEFMKQEEQLNAKYKSALLTLDTVTHERDALQQTLQSADSERKKTIMESKMKIEQLLTKIGEMKVLKAENESLNHLKDENESLKSNYERLSLENKRELSRLETENRQLREVVTQLRNAHKSTQESADIALADRQSYFDTIEQQRKELQVLREKLTNYNSLSEENPQLLQEIHTLQDTLQHMRSDYESRLSSITSLYQSTHRQLSERERMIYDLESKLESNSSDLKVTQQELSSRLKELENLHHVISSMEKESNHALQRHEDLWKEKMSCLESELQVKFLNDSQVLQCKYHEQTQEIHRLQQQLEDEKLLKRKFEIEMISEKKKLHTTLQHALNQLQNSQNDSIDRLLIKNLILRYFQQKRFLDLLSSLLHNHPPLLSTDRSLEVLKIIARVLQFSNEEKVILGLEVPSGSIINSFFQSITNPIMGIVPHAAAAPTPVEGENLAEMWLNYLIHESEVDNSTEIEPHSPSSSRSVLKSSPSPNQSPTITSAKHRSYTLSQSSPTLSPTNGSLSPPSITSRMPNFVNKPSNIRIPSEDSYDGGESEVQINGVRQVAQSPILHPHNK